MQSEEAERQPRRHRREGAQGHRRPGEDLRGSYAPDQEELLSLLYAREDHLPRAVRAHLLRVLRERAKRSRCFICRQRIEDSMRVFP